jgi:hypothetical protein
MNLKIAAYNSTRNPDGTISVIEKYDYAFTAGEKVQGDYTFYQLPAGVTVKDLESVTVSFDDVVQSNEQVVLYYTSDGPDVIPNYGNKTFVYDASTRRICFQYADDGKYNRAPEPGTKVRIEIVNSTNASNSYKRIPMKREWLIQGANPINPALVNPTGTGSNQFQGGYRCTLKLISRAAHGHVRISDDKLAFEYRPDMGYIGTDSFAYRLVNALGQESPAYCIKIDVGT